MKISKRVWALVLSFVMVIGLIPVPAAAQNEQIHFQVIHSNDIHGRAVGDPLDAKGKIIGLPLYKGFVEKMRKQAPVILLDAGDTTHGTPFATLNEGKVMIDAMNDMGFDAMTAGNHDFNYGKDRLLALDKEAKFPILAANVKRADGSAYLPTDHLIKDINGFKVGIFGLATSETKEKSSPKNTEGLVFHDYIKTAQEQIAALKNEGAQFIIALVHLGLDKESKETSEKLAQNVQGIDLIVDGHSHTVLEKGKKVGNTLIVQTGEYLNNIGVVDIKIDGRQKNLSAELVHFKDFLPGGKEADVKPDPKLLAMITAVEKENQKVLDEVVGVTEVVLDGEREQVRRGETNLGNLLTDAMREATGADIAITNGGGIRSSIPPKNQQKIPFSPYEIKRADVFTAFPFTNTVIVISATGQEIVDALIHGVDAYPELAGKFPHVSGMEYTIVENPDKNGVKDVMVGGKPIDLKKNYKVATNDFMAIGGDGYKMFTGKTFEGYEGLLSEVLEQYIKKHQPIQAKVEGRIKVVKGEQTNVLRIAGKDRIETSLKVAQTFEKAETVVLASAYNYADALVAGRLADKSKAPILLIDGANEALKTEITRLGAKKVILVGGESSICQKTENSLKEWKLDITRLSGQNRYQTANAVMDAIADKTQTVVVASGELFADALSAENIAVHKEWPILLAEKNHLDPGTVQRIKKAGVKEIVLVGGTDTVRDEAFKELNGVKIVRLAGETRYETALMTVKTVRNEIKNLYIASGELYPDALTTGALLGKDKAVLLLTPANTNNEKVSAYLKMAPFEKMTVIGGHQSVSESVAKQYLSTMKK